jgi:hypothetical protein
MHLMKDDPNVPSLSTVVYGWYYPRARPAFSSRSSVHTEDYR